MTALTRACGHPEVWELSGNADERSRKMRDLKRSLCPVCEAREEAFIAQLRDAWKREAA